MITSTEQDIQKGKIHFLKEKYLQVRRRTEQLCEPLETEDYIPQPIVDVSPPRWHLAHTTWFFETFLLKKYQEDYRPYNTMYSFLFNSYYQNVGERWQRQERGHLSRPTVKEIYTYRKAVDERMQELMQHISEDDLQEFSDILLLGLNHEQQHQELLITDLKYILCHNPLFPKYNIFKDPYENMNQNLPNDYQDYISFEEGIFEAGYKGNDFYYDNEKPVHKVYLQPYKIRKGLVTNQEYIEFINDDGYKNFRYWLDEGWAWVQENNINQPMYWHMEDDNRYEATLNGYKKLMPNAPVTHISFYEAEAFAAWAGKRLPTEFEWESAAVKTGASAESGNFQDDHLFHPMPLQKKQNELYQLFGDVWEWTQSSYMPYYNYKPAEGAIGEYNGKFMINQMVLRGGSCATPRDHIRPTYRNFFHPDKQWQFTGIRLAE